MGASRCLYVVAVVVLLGAAVPRTLPAQTPLDGYVAEGLQGNLGLQQRRLDLEKSLRALEEARGLFFPALNVEARYSVARGGRTIDLPLGDLLNPAYETLNRLLEAQGAPAAFPTLENQEVRFLRDREQDTRLRVTQPLFQPRILANVQLRRHLAASQEAAVAVYRNALVRDIRQAYYACVKAAQAVEIYRAALQLVRENLRTNESLLRHAKVTHDAVLRANADVLTVAQELAAAETDFDLARSYFNFLLNRPLDRPVELHPLEDAGAQADLVLARYGAAPGDGPQAWQALAVRQRHELARLDAALGATEAGVRLARSAMLPSAVLAVDAGIQGEAYGFTGDAPYAMASFVLQWNLFDGGQNRARLAQARLDRDRLRLQRDEAEQQIRLEVQEAFQRVQVARRSLDTAQERVAAAREGYRLVARRYDEGMVTQVALLDARTTLTSAELNLNVTRADLMTRLAQLDYSIAVGVTAGETLLTARH